MATCRVWTARTSLVTPAHARLLSAVERSRVQEYRLAADRSRFTLAAALTRIVLSAELGVTPEQVPLLRECRWCGGPHGRPRLPDASFQISISHSGDLVMVALAAAAHGAGAVGVDVEEVVAARAAGLATSVLSLVEQDDLALRPAPNRAQDIIRYWVRKEAVLKATGDGLTVPLPGLTVSAPSAPAVLLQWPDRPELAGRITLQDLLTPPGYAGCVALVDGAGTVIEQLDATDRVS